MNKPIKKKRMFCGYLILFLLTVFTVQTAGAQAFSVVDMAGLQVSESVDLTYLAEIQKKYMPFYHRMAYGVTYYLVSAERLTGARP